LERQTQMESANLAAMFAVSEAEATAIRDAFNEGGELSAVVELRRPCCMDQLDERSNT
jgi:hypothetical protein